MDESLCLTSNLAAVLADLPLEVLAFMPVPVKPRSDGWTPERQLAFILRLDGAQISNDFPPRSA